MLESMAIDKGIRFKTIIDMLHMHDLGVYQIEEDPWHV